MPLLEAQTATSPAPARIVRQLTSASDRAGNGSPYPRRVALPFRRILVTFEFSRHSLATLRAVVSLTESHDAVINVLHVLRPDLHSGPGTTQTEDHLAEAYERVLRHWVSRVTHQRVRTFAAVRLGETVETIAMRALALRADLIVMTSRVHSGSAFQRSTAEKVSRLLGSPVLIIPEHCAEQLAYTAKDASHAKPRTILLPTDFSKASGQALRFAAIMAVKNRARLVVAHGAETGVSDGQVHAQIRSWARANLPEGVPMDSIVWPGGHSLYAILSETVRAEADLIVLPMQTEAWARRLRAGSFTDGVIRQAPCPVLCVNEKTSPLDE